MADTVQRPAYLAAIEDLGFTYAEEAQFDLDTLDVDRRVQVRDFASTPHFAPKVEAERYAVQMEHSAFPPVITTRDAWLVDGNTRVEARKIRKDKFHPAVVIQEDFLGGNDRVQEKLFALALTLNEQNGRALTPKEQRAAITTLIDLGWSNGQIEMRAGIKASEINKVRKQMAARARLDGAKLDRVTPTSLAVLGDEKVLLLNDEPYVALANLANDASLNAKEVRGFAKEVLALGSDASKMERITALRSEFAEQIEANKFDHAAKPPISRMLRQHLGFVNKYAANPTALVERNAEYHDAHLAALATGIKVLSEVLSAQDEVVRGT